METKDVREMAKRIVEGERIERGDDLRIFMEVPLDELQAGAHEIQEAYCGKHIDLCTIINGRSGRCGEDCKYCAQAACHKTGIEEYGLMEPEKIYEHALANEKAGVNRFSIVTSGRALRGAEFDKAIEAYEMMNEKLKIELCASHGILKREQFRRLRASGVTSYHHNIETSKRYFPYICTTHTYEDRIRTIKMAQSEDFCVCSGGIIGMGETWEDRLDMAISLHELGIQSIPINALMPVKGTALEGMKQLEGDEILRTIAIFRYINPEANIRLAAGRKLLPKNGASALMNGASASITGDMLTTSGTTIADDMKMLKELGLTNR